MVARASTGMPRTGRPRAKVASTRLAITAARRTLGSGVTSTTNPTRTARDAATRAQRGMPTAAPATITSPMTIAQLAPDTAVR